MLFFVQVFMMWLVSIVISATAILSASIRLTKVLIVVEPFCHQMVGAG